jgi:hypothetical protein
MSNSVITWKTASIFVSSLVSARDFGQRLLTSSPTRFGVEQRRDEVEALKRDCGGKAGCVAQDSFSVPRKRFRLRLTSMRQAVEPKRGRGGAWIT